LKTSLQEKKYLGKFFEKVFVEKFFMVAKSFPRKQVCKEKIFG
jgi:hypothetical protein